MNSKELFEIAPVMMHSIDDQGRLLNVNDTWIKTLGYSKEEVVGRRSTDFLSEKSKKYALEVVLPQFFKEGFCKDIAYQFVAKNGNIIEVLLSGTMEKAEDGSIRTIAVSKDVTELIETRNKLSVILDSFQLGFVDFNVPTNEIFFTEKTQEITGIHKPVIKGVEELVESVHEEDRPELVERMTTALKNKSNFYIKHRMKDGDGWKWVEANGFYFVDEKSEEHFIGTVKNITEEKNLQSALEYQEQFLKLVIDNIPQTIFWKNREKIYQGCNAAFAKDAGVDMAEGIQGKTDYDLAWKTSEADFFREMDEKVMSSGIGEYKFIEPQLQDDGKQAWLETNKIPLHNGDGEVIGILGTYEDISDKKILELDRERLITDLETKNSELEQFTYTVSHDLKSPLVTIKGFLGILLQDLDKGDKERVAEDIGFITTAADHMSQLLNELLELSRIGRVKSQIYPINIRELLINVSEVLAKQIEEKSVLFSIPDKEITIEGDKQRIKQVLQNLIENAIKFSYNTTTPKVIIDFKELRHEYQITIADNGIGIPAEYHKKIFNLFERLDNNVEGTGLGLSLVRKIIETHKGTISVASEGKDKGTKFMIVLPKKYS